MRHARQENAGLLRGLWTVSRDLRVQIPRIERDLASLSEEAKSAAAAPRELEILAIGVRGTDRALKILRDYLPPDGRVDAAALRGARPGAPRGPPSAAVSEERRLEDLDAENAFLRGKLDNLNHDVANALTLAGTSVATYEAMSTRERPDAEKKIAADLKTRFSSLAETLRASLDSLRSTRAAAPPLLSRTDLKSLLREAAQDQEPAAALKKISLRVVLPDGAVDAAADPGSLLTVFRNLIGNAVKYTPAGGSIEAGVKIDGKTAVSYVRDTGIGISKEDQKKVFGGYRTEAGKAEADGSGFGLASIQRALRAQGSTIELESAVGKGSTFSFKLPLLP